MEDQKLDIPKEELTAFVEENGGRVATEEETQELVEKEEAMAAEEADFQRMIEEAQQQAIMGKRGKGRLRGPGVTRPNYDFSKTAKKKKAAKKARKLNRK